MERAGGGETKLPKHISAFMRMYGKIVCLYSRFYLQYLNGCKYETMKQRKERKENKQQELGRIYAKTNKYMAAAAAIATEKRKKECA